MDYRGVGVGCYLSRFGGSAHALKTELIPRPDVVQAPLASSVGPFCFSAAFPGVFHFGYIALD
jgi:hypothetical protein